MARASLSQTGSGTCDPLKNSSDNHPSSGDDEELDRMLECCQVQLHHKQPRESTRALFPYFLPGSEEWNEATVNQDFRVQEASSINAETLSDPGSVCLLPVAGTACKGKPCHQQHSGGRAASVPEDSQNQSAVLLPASTLSTCDSNWASGCINSPPPSSLPTPTVLLLSGARAGSQRPGVIEGLTDLPKSGVRA